MIIHNVDEILCISKKRHFECKINSDTQTIVTKRVVFNGTKYEPSNTKRLQRVYTKPIACFFEREKENDDIWNEITCNSGKRALRGYINKPKAVLPPNYCDDFPYCGHEWHSRF